MWKKAVKGEKESDQKVLLPVGAQVLECSKGGVTGILLEDKKQRQQLAAELQQYIWDQEEDMTYLFVPTVTLYRGGLKSFHRYVKAVSVLEPGVNMDFFRTTMKKWDVEKQIISQAEAASKMFMIILALSRRAEVLIFDNTMEGLQPENIEYVNETLEQLKQQGDRTFILLAHHKNQLVDVADEIFYWKEEA